MILNQVKQKLHLVGYLLTRYFKDAWYHERKNQAQCFSIWITPSIAYRAKTLVSHIFRV